MEVSGITLLRSWGARGSLAVLDQATTSGCNFLLNVLLARWMEPAAYGAFAVGFTLFLFVSGYHNALLLEPMSVLGPGRHRPRLPEYLLAQVRLHVLLTSLLGVLLLPAAAFFWWDHRSGPLAEAILGTSLALPMILFLWVVRRFFYILGSPSRALAGSVLYLLLSLGGLFTIKSLGSVNPLSALLVMGFSSLLAGGAVFPLTHLSGAARGSETPLRMLDILREHWIFGRWIVLAAALISASTQLQTLFCAALLGLEAAGALRAMQIVMLPMAQVITAVATLALPQLSHEHAGGHLRSLRSRGVMLTLALSGLAAVYEVVLLMTSRPLEAALYGGRMAAYSWLIPVFGLVPVFTALSTGYSLILRAAEKPQHFLIVGSVTAPLSVVSGIVFTRVWGLAGTSASIVLASAVTAVVTYCICQAWVPGPPRRAV